MRVPTQCKHSIRSLTEFRARVVCSLEKSNRSEFSRLYWLGRGPFCETILCSTRKEPADNLIMCVSDCLLRVFSSTVQQIQTSIFLTGTLKWEKVPSASEKNSQSKAWYTVKKDSVHIKTKTFSFWSIFFCGGGGSKRKRATVFANQPNKELDTIYYRFYIYSDNEDSKKVIAFLCNIWIVTKSI